VKEEAAALPRRGHGEGAAPPKGAALGEGAAAWEGAMRPEGAAPLPSRRQTLAGAAALAAGWALPPQSRAAAPPSDLDQLARLITLEQRLASAYETALARDAVEPALGETLLRHEREHARGLEQSIRARGGRAPRASVPPPGLGAALASRPAFARFAADLEAETVRAYQDVLATLRTDRLLLPLGSIMASGAQHVVALRQAAGDHLLY
jgi:hypothetical protein